MTVKGQSLRSLILFVGIPFFLGCQGDPAGPDSLEDEDPAQQEQTLPAGHLELLILPGDVDLTVGEQLEFALFWLDGAELYDAPGIKLRWSSDDPGVASVSKDGLVRALAAGSVRIIAEMEGETAEAVVTVRES
jgi:hypothetical protein